MAHAATYCWTCSAQLAFSCVPVVCLCTCECEYAPACTGGHVWIAESCWELWLYQWPLEYTADGKGYFRCWTTRWITLRWRKPPQARLMGHRLWKLVASVYNFSHSNLYIVRSLFYKHVCEGVCECVEVCVCVEVCERVCEGMSEWVSEWVCQWVRELVTEWVCDWVSEWRSVWMSEGIRNWVSELRWVSEYVSEWMCAWMSE